MKTSSAKAKGRRLQQFVAKKISEITGCPCGKDEIIRSREMGQAGVDVVLVGIAKEKFPFSVEAKCQESWSVPAWIRDAKDNQQPGTDWLLFAGRNRFDPVVVMDAEAFFDLYDRYLMLLFGKDHKLKDR